MYLVFITAGYMLKWVLCHSYCIVLGYSLFKVLNFEFFYNLYCDHCTGGLAAQVGWPGLRVGSRLALVCVRQMNRVNSRSDLCHDVSTINIVPCIIIIIITIIIIIAVLPSLVSGYWDYSVYQSCQPLCFGHNDYAFWTFITPLHLRSPELR